MAYSADFLGHIRYADFTTKGWQVSTLDSTGRVDSYGGLDVDADGDVHLAYYHESDQKLIYTTNGTVAWDYETADSGDQVGLMATVKLDSSGKVHMVYLDSGANELVYNTNATGSWVQAPVTWLARRPLIWWICSSS